MVFSRILVVLALAGATGVAAAQPPRKPSGPPAGQSAQQPWKWWQDARWRADLELSADQVARIEEIYMAAGPKMRDGYQRLEPLENQLSKMISGDGITEVEVLRQLDRIEAIRTELSKERTLMIFRMRRVLSPEQRMKLAEMQSRHTDRGRGRVPQPQRH